MVGGVFVALFIKQPGWGLRNPKDFAVSLIESYVSGASSAHIKEDLLNILAEALVLLVNVHVRKNKGNK